MAWLKAGQVGAYGNTEICQALLFADTEKLNIVDTHNKMLRSLERLTHRNYKALPVKDIRVIY